MKKRGEKHRGKRKDRRIGKKWKYKIRGRTAALKYLDLNLIIVLEMMAQVL